MLLAAPKAASVRSLGNRADSACFQFVDQPSYLRSGRRHWLSDYGIVQNPDDLGMKQGRVFETFCAHWNLLDSCISARAARIARAASHHFTGSTFRSCREYFCQRTGFGGISLQANVG
jgi:hypothetical protein